MLYFILKERWGLIKKWLYFLLLYWLFIEIMFYYLNTSYPLNEIIIFLKFNKFLRVEMKIIKDYTLLNYFIFIKTSSLIYYENDQKFFE